MAYAPEHFGRARIKKQTGWATAESSFAAAEDLAITGDLAGPSLTRSVIADDAITNDHVASRRTAGGKLPVDYALTGALQGWSAATPEGNPTEHGDALLAYLALGGAGSHGYRTDLAEASGGSTTTKIGVTDSTGALAGYAILVPLAAGGHGIGWIRSINAATTPHEITISPLPSAPATTGSVLGSRTVWLTRDQCADGATLQLFGGEATAAARLVGLGVTGLTYDLSPSDAPTYQVDTRSTTWILATSGGDALDEAATLPLVPSAQGEYGARLRLAAADFCVTAATLTIEIEASDAKCHDAETGASRILRGRVTMRLEVTVQLDDDIWVFAGAGGAAQHLQLDISTTPGRAFSVRMPAAVRAVSDEPASADGMRGVTMVFEGGPSTYDTGTTRPANAPGALAWL